MKAIIVIDSLTYRHRAKLSLSFNPQNSCRQEFSPFTGEKSNFQESLGNFAQGHKKQTRPRDSETPWLLVPVKISVPLLISTSHQQARESRCTGLAVQSPRRTPGPHPVSSQGPRQSPVWVQAPPPMAPEVTSSGGTSPHPQTLWHLGLGRRTPS